MESKVPSMANGDEQLLLSSRADFMKSVGALAEHLGERVGAIRESMEAAASQDDGRSKLFEEVWRTKLDSLAQEIAEFATRASTNPTLCVMGKRGQGKTSLLSKWLAGEVNASDSGNPLSAILNLPTGHADTTAALVRLRAVQSDDAIYDPRFLYCTMLEERHVLDVPPEKRPKAPAQGSIRVRRDDLPAYWICRFPNRDKDSKHRLVFDSSGAATVMESTTGDSLEAVQWHAREVVVPLATTDAPPFAHGTRTLSVLDVIDAPGGDAQLEGENALWKRHKNMAVFLAAIRELDVLLLVASTDISGIQLGAQFQQEIWFPWLERCRNDEDMTGRLVLAFTKSFQLFQDAEKRLKSNSGPNNEISDFLIRICKNVIEPLAAHPSGVPQLLRAKDARTWPPILFFEKDDEEMHRFRQGIAAGEGLALADRVLDRLFGSESSLNTDLPLGGQCILLMASDVLQSSQITSSEGRSAVARWVVRALCNLLDPLDKGFAALTALIHSYATGGPVALKHANERKQDASLLADRFRALLGDLATPAGNQKALHDLESVQELLRAYWVDNPEGPRLYRGPLCHRRRDQIRDNRNRADPGNTTHIVNHDMVLDDVARDAVEQLRSKRHSWTRDQAEMVARVLYSCLKGDGALQEMGIDYRQAIDRDYEALHRVQTVALERLIRILDFLVKASKDDLGRVAAHCFQINIEEAELVAALNRDVVTWNSEDESRLAAVGTTHATLLSIIEQIPCEKPYVTTDS